ncbi:MAG: ABC transporter permease [Cyclobacteriaceae bacterium]
MFRSYLKIGFRSMTKHWSVSLINISGLALAIAWAITSFIFVDMMMNMDQYHGNKDNIYQVINYVEGDEGEKKWGDSPLLLGPALEENLSQVKSSFRMEFIYGDVKFDKKVFHEFIVFADPEYFTEMDFPFLSGSKGTLNTKDQIVISYNTAKKYFDDVDPIGQQLTIKFDSEHKKSFIVGAVLDEYPYNTSMTYDFFLPMENFFDLKFEDRYDWSYFGDATFVVLEEGADPAMLTSQMDPYIEIQNEQESDWKIKSFELIGLEDLPNAGWQIEGSVAGGNHPAGRYALGIIAGLLVVMACFNYMNIAVSAATRRLKEIALRKVVGSQRAQIVAQFLTENYLQVFFSLAAGVLLSLGVFTPMFNSMIPISIPFEFSSVPVMIAFFSGLLIVVGLLAGAYPAFYISRFQPVAIFRGNEQFGKKSWFSRILTGFQLFLAFITVVGCFLFTDNALYMGQKEWGYDAQGILAMQINDTEQYQKLRDFAEQDPQVTAFTGSHNHIGHSAPPEVIKQQEKIVRTNVFKVGSSYPKFMNLKLIAGAFFNEDIAEEKNNELIVTERFVNKMEWEAPIGQLVEIDSITYRVVGVTEDFYYANYFAYSDQNPVALRVVAEEEFNYAVLKTTPQNMATLERDVEEAWLNFAPNDPVNKTIQANIFDDFYQENRANIIVMLVISGLAIVIACLGLFGLLSFNIQRRLKEFSVRKVLGASSSHIVKNASKQYLWIMGIAFTVGAPAGYLSIIKMIQSIYPEPKETSLIPFFAAVGIMVLTVTLTISGQIFKAVNVNPANNLRSE